MSILITGATGFIGNTLLKSLNHQGCKVSASVRELSELIPKSIKQIPIGNLLPETDWEESLLDVEVVIHLAARVHIKKDKSLDPLHEFRQTNVLSTLNLARQSVNSGVKRFIFISSIGVNGSHTTNKAFTADDEPNPQNFYTMSKLEAEVGLQKIAETSCMEIVIIRPPLVYGPNAPGNFSSLIKLVNFGFPLPLSSLSNKRSFVAVQNLVGLISICISHPKAKNQIFLVSDGDDFIICELIQLISNAMGKRSKLFPFPVVALTFFLRLFRKKEIATRLFGCLEVDIEKTKDLLDWSPEIKGRDALDFAVKSWGSSKNIR